MIVMWRFRGLRDQSPLWMLALSLPARRLAGLSFCVGLVLTSTAPLWAQAGVMHWCPGNRFTDALSPMEARERGCRPAASGRLSQVQPLDAPKLEEPSAAVIGGTDAATSAGAQVPTPRSSATATGPEAVAPQVDAPRPVAAQVQAARDRDARQILEAELQRTRAAQQSLVSSTGAGDLERLQRLRQDEAALRRELARLGP